MSGAAARRAPGLSAERKKGPWVVGHSLFGGRDPGCVLQEDVNPKGLLEKQRPLLAFGPCLVQLWRWKKGED